MDSEVTAEQAADDRRLRAELREARSGEVISREKAAAFLRPDS